MNRPQSNILSIIGCGWWYFIHFRWYGYENNKENSGKLKHGVIHVKDGY